MRPVFVRAVEWRTSEMADCCDFVEVVVGRELVAVDQGESACWIEVLWVLTGLKPQVAHSADMIVGQTWV